MSTETLEGKRALVTGGTRGIGRAISELLLAKGADVTVTGREDRSPRGTDFRGVDLSDRSQAEALADSISKEKWDILVNCAGINRLSPFAEIEPADFDEIMDVNLRVPMLLCRAVAGGMCERQWGRIVNISSIFGVVSKAQRGSYSTSKFALDGMTAALAAEVATHGVLANCVAPGFIDTELTRATLGESGMREMAEQIPAGRLGTAEEVATLVVWLAGPYNTYVSGQSIVIDGGFTRV